MIENNKVENNKTSRDYNNNDNNNNNNGNAKMDDDGFKSLPTISKPRPWTGRTRRTTSTLGGGGGCDRKLPEVPLRRSWKDC